MLQSKKALREQIKVLLDQLEHERQENKANQIEIRELKELLEEQKTLTAARLYEKIDGHFSFEALNYNEIDKSTRLAMLGDIDVFVHSDAFKNEFQLMFDNLSATLKYLTVDHAHTERTRQLMLFIEAWKERLEGLARQYEEESKPKAVPENPNAPL